MVTWSVQEYSCTVLCIQVCAGIFMWSLGLCRNIHVVTWSVQEYSFLHCPVHPGLCMNMPAEPEPFDLCACSCMSYLVGLKPDLCKS